MREQPDMTEEQLRTRTMLAQALKDTAHDYSRGDWVTWDWAVEAERIMRLLRLL